jgi:hypothetical protein
VVRSEKTKAARKHPSRSAVDIRITKDVALAVHGPLGNDRLETRVARSLHFFSACLSAIFARHAIRLVEDRRHVCRRSRMIAPCAYVQENMNGETTSMRSYLYQVRFIGGPSDGVVVAVTSFPFGDRLRMPASPVTIESGTNRCYLPPGQCLANYNVRCKRHSVEDGCPIMCYEYEFAGFESLKTASPRMPEPHRRRRWLSAFLNFISSGVHAISGFRRQSDAPCDSGSDRPNCPSPGVPMSRDN